MGTTDPLTGEYIPSLEERMARTQAIIQQSGGPVYTADEATFQQNAAAAFLAGAAGKTATGSPATTQVVQSGVGGVAALVPAALGALGLTMPAWLAAILGIGTAGVGVAQALGYGEGEGLFGNDLLGGGSNQIVGGVELGGPGLAEPPAQYVIKEWSRDTAAGRVQYYKVQMPGWRKPKTFGYYTAFKRWVVFKAPHLAVIGKGLPSHRQLTRLRRNLSRHSADARTILKIVSPKSLRTPKRGRR